MTNRRLTTRFAVALTFAAVLAGARYTMPSVAAPAVGFPSLPNLSYGEGDAMSVAIAVNGQLAGVTYSTNSKLPNGVRLDNETFTDATGTHARAVLRGTLTRGDAGTDPATSGASYTGSEGVYNIQIQASGADSSTSNTFTLDVGRWGSGDVFVGGGTYTYQVYGADGTFKYDVKVGNQLTTSGFTTGCAANWHTGEVWATNFENNVDVIKRHASTALTPYTDASRSVSTLRFLPGSQSPVDNNVESITFDNAQNMYVGHSFGNYNDADGLPADANGKAIYNDFGAGYINIDAAGNPILTGTGATIPFFQPVSPDGFFEGWSRGVASYLLGANGLKIAIHEQIGKDIHLFPLGVLGYGQDLAAFPTKFLNPRYGLTGADTLDLFGDQKTVIYTSENPYIYRFDLSTGTQLPVIGSTVLSAAGNVDPSYAVAPLDPSADPDMPPSTYGIRVLPPGDGTGGYLVATDMKIFRLAQNGRIVQTYVVTGDPDYFTHIDEWGNVVGNDTGTAEGWFSLAIAPDGRSFWAATRQDVFHFDVSSGALLGTKIHATDGATHTATVVDGMCVMNEYRAAREVCGNGIDDDGDGVIDNGCFRLELCSLTSPGDDDGNGLVDYNDPACYPSGQPANTICDANGNTSPSVAGFCGRTNAEGDAIAIDGIPLPCTTDCTGWTFNYTATGLPPGLSINPTTGQITGSPQYSIVANVITAPPVLFNVTVSGTWTQSGQAPITFSGSFPWTIRNTNRPPVAGNDAARVQAGASVTIDVRLNDADPDGDAISILPATITTPLDANGVAKGTAVISADGTKIVYTAPAGSSGVVTFFYQVQDNYGVPAQSNQAKVTVTINGAPIANNDAYTMQAPGSLTVTAVNGIILNAAGRDTDPEGTVLTVYSNTGTSHGSVTVNPDGSFTYTPVVGYYGTDTFTYKVTDGEALSNTATVTITMPFPPVANNDAYSTLLNTALVVNLTFDGLLGNDTDPQGRAITVSTNTNPAHGTLAMSATNDGTFTYTPATNYTGTDSFTYRVNNGFADSNTATVTITIKTTNHPPVAVNDSYSMNEGTTLTVPAGDIMRNDSDPDGDLMTAQLVTSTPTGTLVFTNGTGAFTFTPAPGFLGDITYTYQVTDPYGLSSAPATVTIHVNALPVAVNDAYTTPEDTTLTVPARGILLNDTDRDANAVLSVVLPIISQPSHGSVTVNADGSFVYTPGLNYNGTDTFTYKVVDDRGGVSVNPATVTITITPVNDPPVAVADAYSTLQGTTLTVSDSSLGIRSNDTDPDNATNTLAVTVVTTTANGALTVNADGTFTYTPNATFSGTDTFTYYVTDPLGAQSNIATVTITVTPTSITGTTTPVCATNSAYVDYSLAAVNFTFPSGSTARIDWIDSGNRTVRTDTAMPLSGRALWPGMVLNASGQPTDWPGWYSDPRYPYGALWVEGADGFELTKPIVTMRFTVGTRTVNVPAAYPATTSTCAAAPPANQPPVAKSDSYTTPLNTMLTVPAPGILGNDRDPEGGPITVILPVNTPPTSGTLSQNADGSFVFVPATGFLGSVTYSYKVKDVANLSSNLATVTISVLGSVSITMPDVTVTYDGNPHPATCTVRGQDGSTLVGVVTYTPAVTSPVHVGVYTATCTYTNTDGRFQSGSATATVTILPRPLVITANNQSKIFGTVFSFAGTEFTTSGLVSTDSVTSATLTSVGTPATAAAGAYPIVPSAAVGTGLSDYSISYVNGTLTVTNDVPVAVNDMFTTLEDTSVSGSVAVNDTMSLDGGNAWSLLSGVSNGTLTFNPNGTFTYKPNANFNGNDTFNYTLCDFNGDCSTATVVITVTPVNDVPVAVNDGFSTNTGTAYSGTVATNDTLSGDGGNVWSVVTTVAHGTLVFNTNGTFTYTPATGYTGADAFTYKLCDANGDCSTATVSITVTAVVTGAVGTGDTATIGFWHNSNGQALIKAVNGGSTSKNLGNWLAATYPYLFGAYAGATNNLTGKTNAQVAAYDLTLFSSNKWLNQVLGGALATYVTNSTLAGGNYAATYKFNVSTSGTGSKTYNVGAYGTAIGLSNNTSYTVSALLAQANLRKQQGTFDSNAFNVIFDGINQKGDIK